MDSAKREKRNWSRVVWLWDCEKKMMFLSWRARKPNPLDPSSVFITQPLTATFLQRVSRQHDDRVGQGQNCDSALVRVRAEPIQTDEE
jgi:hypothetical protein